MEKKSIAVAKGNGIGPEIMDAVIEIFDSINVPLDYNFVEMGRDVFLDGYKLGMTPQAKETVENLGILFKGPMETPKGGGNRSINVVSRKMWGTYANCRVFNQLPGVETIFSKAGIDINLTIVRENLEDTYGGVEHMLTDDVAIGKRFASAPGAYQVHKYAFEYASQQNITSVVCGHKANIMKITDGMFLDIFYEVAKEYPHIKASDIIVDDLCMKLVSTPQNFELIVLPNLQGDIVSDLCAGLIGGLGFAPSANIGSNIAIFEAVHGTAPDIVGKQMANPTALLLSGLMMLNFLGLTKQAKIIEIALFETLKNGIHTPDLKSNNNPVTTKEYIRTIIQTINSIDDSYPQLKNLVTKSFSLGKATNGNILTKNNFKGICKGVDLSIQTTDVVDTIVSKINDIIKVDTSGLNLKVVSNRGTSLYPEFSHFTENTNAYSLRFLSDNEISSDIILQLATKINSIYPLLSIEFLKEFNGKIGYTII